MRLLVLREDLLVKILDEEAMAGRPASLER